MATFVKSRQDEDIRSLILRFKKQVLRANIIEELRERRFYKKPSELRKERLAAKRRGKSVMNLGGPRLGMFGQRG